MTRQLISTNEQPLLRSSHAKRPPQSGFVQVGQPERTCLSICSDFSGKHGLSDKSAERISFRHDLGFWV